MNCGWTPDDVRALSLDEYEIVIEDMKKAVSKG